jgi:hypothetical protein
MKHKKKLIKSAKDYSLWDGGDIRFCGQKQTLILIISGVPPHKYKYLK